MKVWEEIAAAVRSGKSMGQVARERGISEQAVHSACRIHGVRSADKHYKPLALCSVDGCPRPVLQRGWCRMHWERWFRFGSTVDRILWTQPCGTVAAYQRHLRHGEKTCADCKRAIAKWHREYYARRHGAA